MERCLTKTSSHKLLPSMLLLHQGPPLLRLPNLQPC